MPTTSRWVSETLVLSSSIEVWPKHGLGELLIVMTSTKTSRSSKNDAGPKGSLMTTTWEKKATTRTTWAQKMNRGDASFGNKLNEKAPVIDLARSRVPTRKIRKHIRRPNENIKKKYSLSSMTSSNLATRINMMLLEMIPVEQITKPTCK